MYVEDLIGMGINMTAEIPEDHAIHFKEMCKLFASIDSHELSQSVDEYLLRLSSLRSANTINDPAHSEMPSAERTTNRIDETAASSSQHLQRHNSCCSRDPRLAGNEPVNTLLMSAEGNRQCFEVEMFALVAQFVLDLDPTMRVFPFGSTQYGIASINSNFNLLITTGPFWSDIKCLQSNFKMP